MDTEEQQLEELKRWWNEHGRTVLAGIVLGIAVVGGYTGWRAHVDTRGEALSARYERLVNTAAIPNRAGAVEQTNALIAEHPDSTYAGLAALVGAHAAYKGSDITTAQRLLQWAAEHGDGFEVRNVARLRLSRILGEQGQHDAALAQLDQITGKAFTAPVAEARGDVLAAKRDAAGARTAYQGALAQESLNGDARARIQLKLDALAAGG